LTVALTLKSYESQSKLSLGLAVLGGVAAVGVLFLMHRNFDAASFYLTYNPKASWLIIVGLGIFVALASSTVGFFVALHSAGQRRNKRSALAWQAFFLNAIIITITLCAACFLWYTRNPLVPKAVAGG
jgi:hypothetical protein